MTPRILSPGNIIDAYCTSCRTIMNHTIVSMIEVRPARVQCNTCGGVHNYRREKAAKPAAKATPAKPATRQSKQPPGEFARQEWAALLVELDASRALPYNMQGVYKVGNLVKHPLFGLGVVKQLPGPHKAEILFEGGIKLLRCG